MSLEYDHSSGDGELKLTDEIKVAWQIVFFIRLDLHHTSPDVGERQYRFRAWKRRFDARA